jgi:hypothetical protein
VLVEELGTLQTCLGNLVAKAEPESFSPGLRATLIGPRV